VPDADDPSLYEDLNTRSIRLVGAAVSGNSAFLGQDLGDEQTGAFVERALTGLLHRFAEMSGAPARAAIALGTIPTSRDGVVLTGVRIRNESDGIEDIGFLWRDGRFVGLEDTAYEISFPIVRVSEDAFAGYHLGLAKVIPIGLELGGGDEEGALTLGLHRANRLKAHSHDHGDGGQGQDDDNGD
jgi:hypothetical protein